MSIFDPFTPEERVALEVDDVLMGRNQDLTLLSTEALQVLGLVRNEEALGNDDAESEYEKRCRRARNYWKWSGREHDA